MGMDPNGNIRELTEEKPLQANEVLISEPEKEQLEKMTRQERRAIYRKLAKQEERLAKNARS